MIHVDFDTSMGRNSWWCFENFSKTKVNAYRYKFYKQLYSKNYISNFSQFNSYKIPKIIHQIWLGPKQIPEKFHSYMESWKKFNPEWEYKLWTDNEVKNFKFEKLGDYFSLSKNYGQKADILRYEILYKYGGLYADVDFECLTNFNDLNKAYHFYCGIHPPHKIITPSYPLEVGNALIGSVPQHPIIEEVFKLIEKRWSKIYNNKKYDDNWKVVLSTWYPIKDAIIKSAYKKDFLNIVFPATYFYPILLEKTRRIGIDNPGDAYTNKYDESFAIHHWGESWFNNFIAPN